MVLGTVVAISLRVVFAGLVTTLMQMAYLKLVGGTLLLWIAVKLLAPEENGKSGEIQAGRLICGARSGSWPSPTWS